MPKIPVLSTPAAGRRRVLAVLAALAAGALLEGCYYAQAVRGQLEIWRESRPLDEVIADPATPPELAAKLRLLAGARVFASRELLLPDNGSYRSYADLERDYVVWNVIAAPEFSLEPETWCFPVVGCVAYRGYFSKQPAHRFAAELRDAGFDVFVSGAAAYSTLGRFEDPFLNTMMRRDELDLVALLFHELAHQRLYVRDDTAFNESFATTVAETGLERWLEARGEGERMADWRRRRRARDAMMHRVRATRRGLAVLYASDLPEDVKRRRKRALLEALAADVARPARGEGVDAELNNAWLASLALYRGQVPAFRRLLDDCDGDLACFYRAAEALARCSPAARADALAALLRE